MKKTQESKNLLMLKLLESLENKQLSDKLLKNFENETGEYILFSGSVMNFIALYYQYVDEKLSILLQDKLSFLPKISHKVQFSVEEWLSILNDHKDANKKISSYLILNGHYIYINKYNWNLANQIWILCSDRSTDFNYYSKRFVLTSILKLTFAYWLKDDSQNFTQTRDFLSSQLIKLGQFAKFKKQVSDFFIKKV